ncbi:hypothetical protein TKK_0009432 [Trichogramma kaykai]
MTLAEFEYILSKLESSLSKDWCNLHISIFPEQQLVKTIRFLVTDKDFEDLATQFDIGHSTACVYVRECLKFIWEILQPLHIPIPTHADFPANSGSAFYNYKRFHSCVLQAVVDTDGKFIFIEVCPYGSQSDGGIFGASQLQKAVKQGLLPIPEKDELPSPNSCKSVMPYYFIGDRAYPLKPYLMKPIRGNNLSPSQKILISVCHEPGCQEDERDVDDEDLTYFINEKCEVDENEHGSEFQEASRERQKVIQCIALASDKRKLFSLHGHEDDKQHQRIGNCHAGHGHEDDEQHQRIGNCHAGHGHETASITSASATATLG